MIHSTSIIRMKTFFSLLKLLLFASLSSKAKPTTLLCETNMFVEWLTQWEFFFLFRLFQCERSAKMRTKMKKVFFMKFFSRSIFLCVLTRTCAFGCACVYSTIYECIRKWWNKYCERHVIGGMTLILLIVKSSFFIKWTTPFQLNCRQSCRFDIFFAIDFDDVIRKLLIWLLVVLARDKQHLCHHIVPNEKNCLRFRPETIYFCCVWMRSWYIYWKQVYLSLTSLILGNKVLILKTFIVISQTPPSLLLFMTSACISCYKSLATFSLSLAAMLSW